MIRKMKPVTLSEASQASIQRQLNSQVVERSAPKSTDPKNFPVFTIPAGKKVLVYVPNHTVECENGSHELRMDKPILHAVRDGNQFRYLRCIHGIEDAEAGFDGSCPLCAGTSDPWDLARAIINQKCRNMGLDPEDKENAEVKSIRQNAFSDRCVKESERYYTFPIVVFETDADCKNILQDEHGNIKYTIQWYHIKEKMYNETWAKSIAEMEDEPENPAGYFFVLSYVYDTKGKPANARDSARALSVHPKTRIGTMKGMDKLKAVLDAKTEEWTPAKAAETVISNNLFSKEDLEGVTDDLLAHTRSMLAMYKGMDEDMPVGIGANTAEIAPALRLGAKVGDNGVTNAVAMTEETDEDFEMEG